MGIFLHRMPNAANVCVRAISSGLMRMCLISIRFKYDCGRIAVTLSLAILQ